jgi:hypothetical protein
MKSWMNGANFDNILSRFLYGVIYNKDYDMKFSISSLVSTLDPYQPSSFAVGLDMGVSG